MSASATNRLREWRDCMARDEIVGGAEEFMGKPDAWYETPHWFCINGHVSGRFLKSEERGDLCLDCQQPVVLGPIMGEALFAPIAAALRAALSQDKGGEDAQG